MMKVQFNRSPLSGQPAATIAITPLIDIMTILLIFVILNMSTEALTDLTARDLALPLTVSGEQPDTLETMVVLSIGKNGVSVDNKWVMSSEGLSHSPSAEIPEISRSLREYEEGEKAMVEQGLQTGFTGHVKILADRDIPFIDLLRVMRTCSVVGYDGVYLGAMPSR